MARRPRNAPCVETSLVARTGERLAWPLRFRSVHEDDCRAAKIRRLGKMASAPCRDFTEPRSPAEPKCVLVETSPEPETSRMERLRLPTIVSESKTLRRLDTPIDDRVVGSLFRIRTTPAREGRYTRGIIPANCAHRPSGNCWFARSVIPGEPRRVRQG